MKIRILYGTESGNSEMIAEDIAAEFGDVHEAKVTDLADVDPSTLVTDTLYLIVCSTYGDGELPKSAFPFFRTVESGSFDFTGVRYAMLGLGDSDYVYSYSQGSEIIDKLLTDRGAVRVGEYGRHDAAENDDPSEIGLAWAKEVLEHSLQSTE